MSSVRSLGSQLGPDQGPPARSAQLKAKPRLALSVVASENAVGHARARAYAKPDRTANYLSIGAPLRSPARPASVLRSARRGYEGHLAPARCAWVCTACRLGPIIARGRDSGRHLHGVSNWCSCSWRCRILNLRHSQCQEKLDFGAPAFRTSSDMRHIGSRCGGHTAALVTNQRRKPSTRAHRDERDC
jgi:hypothetical protein